MPLFMQMNPNGNNKGVSIIEILVVIAIINIALVSLLSLAVFSLKTSTFIKETNQANFLAQEGIEAVRSFRDGTNWDAGGLGNLTIGIAYHPEKSGDTPPRWQLIQGEEIVNSFTRKVEFENVQRDGNDNIIDSGGTNDPNTKKVAVTVFWEDKTVELITYLTNWR